LLYQPVDHDLHFATASDYICSLSLVLLCGSNLGQYRKERVQLVQHHDIELSLKWGLSKISDLHTTSLVEEPCRLQAIGEESHPLIVCNPVLLAVRREHRACNTIS
jgi:hypothetical protein